MNLGLKALTLKAFYDEDFAVREFGPVLAWALSEKLAVSGLNASKTGKKHVLARGARLTKAT